MTEHCAVARVMIPGLLLVLSGCFGGDRAVSGQANGVIPVSCTGAIGMLDAESCGLWGELVLPMQPDATNISILIEGSVDERVCEVAFFLVTGEVASTRRVACAFGR